MHHTQFERFLRIEEFAFQHIRLRTQQAQNARHFGDAARARNQPQIDFWKAELNFWVVHRNAVMPDKGQLQTAA